MKKMVVVFVDGARKGSCLAFCENLGGLPPAVESFQEEARRMMIADGVLTAAEADHALFKVQD